MKVYSWKTLLAIIFAGGVFVILNFEDLMAGEVSAFVFMIWFGYLILKGLWVSFTKEGFEEDERRSANSKKIYKRLFGSWALIAPWGHVILLLLSAATAKLLPSHLWLSILFIVGGLVYAIVFSGLVRKHMKSEEKIEHEDSEEL